MNATVFDIQRFSTHDGPGIRTTVFFKGCSLNCFWCHNPESILPAPEILFFKAKCIGCGRCASAGACPSGAREISGRSMTVGEVMAEVEKDDVFYKRSGGGVTASGGEALLQSKFVAALFSVCKEKGFHTALDTAGNLPFNAFEEVLPFTDLFLYDIKAADAALHKKGCGADNSLILENLRRLCAAGANVTVRVPVIPGFNDSVSEMTEIGKIIRGLNREPDVELLPFHRMGAAKYDSLDRDYAAKDIAPPDEEKIKTLRRLFHG